MSNQQPDLDFSNDIGDAELLAYLDGEVSEALAQQIEQSPLLQARLQALTRQERHLSALLYRVHCPDAHELGEYQLQLLPEARADAVAQHVARCPHCRHELADMQAYLAEVEPELSYTLLDRVKVLIARLLPEGGAGMSGQLSPALAGLRGVEEGPLLYLAAGVQVSLDVQADAASPVHKSILGLVTGADPGGWRARLWKADEEISNVAVDELGNFVIEHVEPATYHLVLQGEEVEIHIQEFSVG